MKQTNNASGVRMGFSYAWVILSVIFIGQLAAFGMRASFGAYISPWESDFSVGRSVVTSISTLNFIIFAISQPFLGRLNDYVGKNIVPVIGTFLLGGSLFLVSRATQIWQVYALFGVGFSLGVAGSRDSVTGGIITNWFTKRRGFALGLVMVGSALGQLIIVPANIFIIERYGWRTAMATLSIIITAVVGPLYIIFLRYKPADKGLKPYGYEELPDSDTPSESPAPEVADSKPLPIFEIFKTKALWTIAISYFICGFTDVGIIQTHLIPMSEGKGFDSLFVALAFSVIAIVNIGATLIIGHLSDKYSRKRQVAVLYVVRALTYVFLIFIRQPALLLVFAAVFGMVEMATAPGTNSLAVQIFNKYSVGAVLGVVAVCHQMGGAAGSWLPGLIYDMTGSYDIVLVLAAVLLIAGALAALQIPEPDKKISSR